MCRITNPSIQSFGSILCHIECCQMTVFSALRKPGKVMQTKYRQRRSWTTTRLWFLFCLTRLCFRGSVVMFHYFMM